MGTKVMALVVVMGAASAGPAEAQIGERAGRAGGSVIQGGRDLRYDDHCWDGDRGRRGDREVRCDERARAGTAYGQSGRYDARDVRRDDRIGDRRDARTFGIVRAHGQLHDRLDYVHRDWHRHRGWHARDRHWRRDHDALHRHLRRTHDGWHREVGWRADHHDGRRDRRF